MLHFSWRRMAWPCILAVISSGLYVADGAVHIDQASALAGNVTPGDAPGFPVTISESGSYRLSGNLTVSDLDTTAIQISADFVTLDLNGFSIVGPVLCTSAPTTCLAPGSGIGVQVVGSQAPGPRGVRILNGSVRGTGLIGSLMTGDGSLAERITVDSNAGGGMSVAGSVVESSATHNDSFGIIGLTVRDCTAVQNAGDGIILDSGGLATATSPPSMAATGCSYHSARQAGIRCS